MPSGAKRRKAAKKKKEKEANINPSTNNPQGNDDLKSQDEKGSDGGEGSSPAYHDHDDHHDPFNEGREEVEEGDPSAAHPSVSEIKSTEEVPGDITSADVVGGQEVSVVRIESDLKSEESSDRINDSIEHVESAEQSRHGNGKSSGTSNFESPNDKNSKDESDNSKQKAVTSEDLTYPVDSSAVVGGGQEVNVVNIESDLKSEESSDRINDSVEHVESAKESPYGNGNSSGTSNIESLNENNSKDEPCNSKQKAIISEDLTYPVDSSPTKMTFTTENAAVEETGNLVVEPYVKSVKEVASVCEVKSSDNGSALLEKSTVYQGAPADLAMKKNEDKVHLLPDQHVRTPGLVESTQTECDSKVSASLSDSPTPITESTKDADHIKGSETPVCSENQPQVVSAPCMVQKTSWLSCCGLFGVLSGSDR